MINSEDLTASRTYWIGSKRYFVEKSIDLNIQSISNDSRVYGWVVEYKSVGKYGNVYIPEEFWLNLNNKIYFSHEVALDAVLKRNELENLQWRIRPIYIMDDSMYREFTIDKILDDNTDTKTFPIKCWKLIDDTEINYNSGGKFKYSKGTLFIQLENGSVIMLKNCVEPINVNHRYQLNNNLIPNNRVIEVELKDEKWAYPHLLKELKEKLKLK